MEKRVQLNSIPAGEVFTYAGLKFIVLEQTQKSTLVISAGAVAKMFFDKSGSNNWRESSLRKYLNNDFLNFLVNIGADKADFLPMTTDLTAVDGCKDYGNCEDIISLISCDQYRQYRRVITNISGFWWLCTPCVVSVNYFKCVKCGCHNRTLEEFSANNFKLWVRPICRLKSSTLVNRTV